MELQTILIIKLFIKQKISFLIFLSQSSASSAVALEVKLFPGEKNLFDTFCLRKCVHIDRGQDISTSTISTKHLTALRGALL